MPTTRNLLTYNSSPQNKAGLRVLRNSKCQLSWVGLQTHRRIALRWLPSALAALVALNVPQPNKVPIDEAKKWMVAISEMLGGFLVGRSDLHAPSRVCTLLEGSIVGNQWTTHKWWIGTIKSAQARGTPAYPIIQKALWKDADDFLS